MNLDDEGTGTPPCKEAGDSPASDEWTGSAAVIEAIYTAHKSRITTFVRRRIHPQDVPDIVQECFQRLISSRMFRDASIASPGAFLTWTAQNLLKNRAGLAARAQRLGHQRFDDSQIAGPDPHAALEARDEIRRAEEVIARLSPKTRDIFLMHRLDELSYGEIAKIKGMNRKRVEKHISKALIAIRRARDVQS